MSGWWTRQLEGRRRSVHREPFVCLWNDLSSVVSFRYETKWAIIELRMVRDTEEEDTKDSLSNWVAFRKVGPVALGWTFWGIKQIVWRWISYRNLPLLPLMSRGQDNRYPNNNIVNVVSGKNKSPLLCLLTQTVTNLFRIGVNCMSASI